ncbi:hypothetical protein [Antarcticirhabdus aurantiaca]|uniref:Uncharacterized protein n=1 Tax=Antarcticirhabdus aurantiaca TaxID=2606717 RepID=A0ACD4NRQ1_9HYPH|nr:hypothetical protein OXU80_03665 [Jeongeuplla avenae]
MEPPAPAVWTDGLQWIFAALLAACAWFGPHVLKPILERWAKAGGAPPSPMGTDVIVTGAALADKVALAELAEAIRGQTTVQQGMLAIMQVRLKMEQDEDRREEEEARLQRALDAQRDVFERHISGILARLDRSAAEKLGYSRIEPRDH